MGSLNIPIDGIFENGKDDHGGLFLICNESDGTDIVGQKFEKIIDGMKVYTGEQIENALKTAGFSDVKTDYHPSKPWITVLAKK